MSSIPDQELDYHYSPSRWSHRMSSQEVLESHVKTVNDVEDAWCAATREAQWILDVEEGVSYGEGERQKLDVYTPKNSSGKKGSPIFVYIHGGYWQEEVLGRENSGFMAQPLAAAGATVIPIGYDLCPHVSLHDIVLEIKEAISFIFKLAKERHSGGIYLCGHSAGAHLAAMMLMTSFQDDDPFDSELIKASTIMERCELLLEAGTALTKMRAILVSGVYDLRPLVKTSINGPLRLTEEDAWRYSPANFVREMAQHSTHRDVLIAVGEYDSPEFRRQSGELEKSLRDCGVKTRYMDVPDTDHFNVVEKLRLEAYSLTKECLRLMQLPRK